MSPTISFFGATETVTGSRYLIETERARVLVDCGLFQGPRKLRERNWAGLPFRASSLDAVVLTHAHIDHSGYLPRLCADGFTGRVHCTGGTRDLLRILLPDSGYLQEEDARRANKYGYSRHHPAQPLYTRDDAVRSLDQLTPTGFGGSLQVAPGITATFTRAGHILGSACVALRVEDVSITFTGDVGRPVDPIMKAPDPLGPSDFLVTESTYGDRRHPDESVDQVLTELVNEAVTKRGVVLVPAFAVGRSQHLLHLVARAMKEKRIPRIPVYLDSPMAINATTMFCDHPEDHRLSRAECHAMCEVAQYSRTPEDSKAIDRSDGPMIVISASGMATGGRILHHLRRFLPERENVVLVVGYQAAGTRGRALVDGADELKIHGQYVRVGARVRQVHGLSAHADYAEMLEWLGDSDLSPRKVFVTHGEPHASEAFADRLTDNLGWDTIVPDDGSSWTLE